jgi:Sulfate permease family
MFRLARGLSLSSYRREWLAKDVVAGIVLSTLLVPQGMAYAELAGLPPGNRRRMGRTRNGGITHARVTTFHHGPTGWSHDAGDSDLGGRNDVGDTKAR